MAEEDSTATIDALVSAFQGMRQDLEKLAPGTLWMDGEGGAAEEPVVELEPAQSQKASTMDVFVRMFVRRVFNVDTVKQTFGVQITMKFSWLPPPTEVLPEEGESDWEPAWAPKYRFRRIMADNGKEEMFYTKQVDGQTWIVAEFDHLLEISEQLELHSFPVDTQDLCVEILSIPPTEKVQWQPWPRDEGGVCELRKDRVALNDFALVKEMPLTYRLATTEGDARHSTMIADVKVYRMANYYILNVAAVMLVIVSFTLGAWATHPGDIASRHGTDFTLILMAVAFKLVLASMLPKVSYVTLLDVYVMGGFLFLTAVTICHTILPFRHVTQMDLSVLTHAPVAVEAEAELLRDDKISFWAFTAIWVLFNVVYFSALWLHGRGLYRSFVRESRHEQALFDKEIDAAREA